MNTERWRKWKEYCQNVRKEITLAIMDTEVRESPGGALGTNKIELS